MTRKWLVGLAALSACWPGEPGATSFDGRTALGYVERQVAFGPRVPNTPGHRGTGDWILEHLRRTTDSVEVQEWIHVTQRGDTLNLRNFIGRFRPGIEDRVLYVAHWDTRPTADREPNLALQRRPIPGANDGGSGVAVLLGVADVLSRTPPSVGVDLLFVDGEDFGEFTAPYHDVLIGSRYYAREISPAGHPLFAVVWDMVGDADLEIYQERYSVQYAPEVVERVWGVARDLGYTRYFRPEVRHAITDDHIPLLNAGVRAIVVIDFDYGPGNAYWHTHEDTPDKLSWQSLQVVGDVAVALVR